MKIRITYEQLLTLGVGVHKVHKLRDADRLEVISVTPSIITLKGTADTALSVVTNNEAIMYNHGKILYVIPAENSAVQQCRNRYNVYAHRGSLPASTTIEHTKYGKLGIVPIVWHKGQKIESYKALKYDTVTAYKRINQVFDFAELHQYTIKNGVEHVTTTYVYYGSHGKQQLGNYLKGLYSIE